MPSISFASFFHNEVAAGDHPPQNVHQLFSSEVSLRAQPRVDIVFKSGRSFFIVTVFKIRLTSPASTSALGSLAPFLCNASYTSEIPAPSPLALSSNAGSFATSAALAAHSKSPAPSAPTACADSSSSDFALSSARSNLPLRSPADPRSKSDPNFSS